MAKKGDVTQLRRQIMAALYTLKIQITLGVLSWDFFTLCSKLLTGYLCGGSRTTDNPQQREARKRPWPLQGKTQFPWVLEHSLLVTNARKLWFLDSFLTGLIPRHSKSFYYSIEGSSYFKKWTTFKMLGVQISYLASRQARLSQEKPSGWEVQAIQRHVLFSLCCYL